MICRFIRDTEELEKFEKDLKGYGYVRAGKDFYPPNLAIAVISYKRYYYIKEVPREEVSKFNTYMHDIWK